MENQKVNILYVDDEVNNLNSFKATFRFKYNVFIAISGSDAIAILNKEPIDIIITDQRMPGMTGVEFLESIIPDFPDPMRILLTGYADMTAVIEAINKGKIYHYLTKPWKEEEVDTTIKNAIVVYNEKMEERAKTTNLAVSNNQLEFLLRQKLLS